MATPAYVEHATSGLGTQTEISLNSTTPHQLKHLERVSLCHKLPEMRVKCHSLFVPVCTPVNRRYYRGQLWWA